MENFYNMKGIKFGSDEYIRKVKKGEYINQLIETVNKLEETITEIYNITDVGENLPSNLKDRLIRSLKDLQFLIID